MKKITRKSKDLVIGEPITVSELGLIIKRWQEDHKDEKDNRI